VPTRFELLGRLRGCKPAWNLEGTSKISATCAYLAKTRVKRKPVLRKLDFNLTLAWVERLVAGYFSKLAGISKWRQAAVASARARK